MVYFSGCWSSVAPLVLMVRHGGVGVVFAAGCLPWEVWCKFWRHLTEGIGNWGRATSVCGACVATATASTTGVLPLLVYQGRGVYGGEATTLSPLYRILLFSPSCVCVPPVIVCIAWRALERHRSRRRVYLGPTPLILYTPIPWP